MQFNHEHNNFLKGLYIEKDLIEMANMCSEFATKYINKEMNITELSEMIHKKAKYNEILCLATMFILRGIISSKDVDDDFFKFNQN